MKFVIDQQLPQALAAWLAARGHEAEHVRHIGLRDADGREIWKYAEASGAAILTKDGDFALLRRAAGSGPLVVWLRIGNATTAALLRWLEVRWAEVEAALATDVGVLEVR